MKKRILVVDDEEVVTRLISAILKSATVHEVEITTNPYDAFARASTENYDLLISDVQMPGLDGTKLYLALGVEADGLTRTEKAPKLLLMSGALDAFTLNAKRSFIRGSSFLQKPFSPALLVAQVESILAETNQTVSASGEKI